MLSDNATPIQKALMFTLDNIHEDYGGFSDLGHGLLDDTPEMYCEFLNAFLETLFASKKVFGLRLVLALSLCRKV